ncbi:MAG: phosphatase PAP2 family protein [Nocardioides sp.]|uniref:phosphatase PAP2 family protein n=1 Tax=Nocardioides sp. TaxID=35761 RepID=UPI0039E4E114
MPGTAMIETGDVATTSPPTAAPRSWWQRLAGVRAGVRELLLITVLYVAYTGSRLFASDNREEAMTRAHQLLHIEQAIGLDWERALNSFFVDHGTIGLLACYWYSTAHYILTLGVLIWLYARGRERYLPARRALVIGTALALALYLMLPTAPPRFLPHEYHDILLLHADQGWWGADASAPKGMGDLTNELAAFPSLHCGWSLWVALVVTRNARSRIAKVLAWLGALLTAVVVVGTGNHWTLDVIVGWIVIVAGVVAVSAFTSGPRLPAAVGASGERSGGRSSG